MQIKSERLVTLIEPEALQCIDRFRWERRLQSRAEAVRELIKIGLNTKTAPEGKFADHAPDAVEA